MRHLKLRTICRGGVHKEIGLNGAAVISCIFKAKNSDSYCCQSVVVFVSNTE